MIIAQPNFKGLVDLLDGFVFIAEELVPYGSELTLNLASALGPVWRRMHQINTVSGTYNFEMTAGIGRTIIDIKALGDTKSFYAAHKIKDQRIDRFGQIKSAMNDIPATVIQDYMQVCLFLFFAMVQFGAMEKVCHP